jgi:RND family efflux transporter MFP subunit
MLTACSGGDAHDADHDDHDHEHEEAEGHHAGEINLSEDQIKEIGLTTEEVAPGSFTSVMKVGGEVQSLQGDEQTVVATMAGVVRFADRSITEGTAVSASQTIATISAKGLQDGDQMAKARAAFESAQRELQRAEQLIADKVISQKDYEQARLNYETARATYQSGPTGQGVSAGQSGYVKQLLVNQGDFVAVGQPIAVISQNKRLQLRALVPESRYNQLQGVSSANFRMAYDSQTLHRLSDLNGRLLSAGRAADASGYVPVTFEFDNVGNILPGSYAEVYLLTSPREGVISVANSALTEEQGLYFVYVQIEPDAFLKRQVTLGATNGERTEVTSGLAAGEKVVTRGAVNVKLASASGSIPEGCHQH